MTMGNSTYRDLIESILSAAGVSVNGDRPWDIRVSDDRFFRRVVADAGMGLGESYVEGWWDCDSLDDFFFRIMPSRPQERLKKTLKTLVNVLGARVSNPARRSRAFEIGERHYDLGNDLFTAMLDRRMIYSCAYWKEANGLDAAQEAKLDLICRKLGLESGDRVLDVGCGWGGLVRFAAERYNARCLGITVSREQAELGGKSCSGLPAEIRLQDYRDLDEEFDHVVSVGMFEHVGYKNYRTFMQKVHGSLRDDGLFLLHTIGNATTQMMLDPWFAKYVFPNSHLPSLKQITTAVEGLFVIEDIHNIGHYYDPTLLSWFENFDRNWGSLADRYGQRFYRMWKYYLLSCAGTFRARDMHVWQIVMSKQGVGGGYKPVR